MTARDPSTMIPAEPVEVLVRLGGEDLGQRGAGGGHRQRVAVEGADLLVGAVGDAAHDLLGPADGPAGYAAAHRLGEAHHVRADAQVPGGPPVGGGDAALDLVEGEQGAVLVDDLAHALQVALPRVE